MDSITSNLLKQSDVQGRLRLFRYGLVVITVVTFIVTLLAPWAMFQQTTLIPNELKPGILDGLQTSLLITGIVLVISVVSYFAYREVLNRTVGKSAASSETKA